MENSSRPKDRCEANVWSVSFLPLRLPCRRFTDTGHPVAELLTAPCVSDHLHAAAVACLQGRLVAG